MFNQIHAHDVMNMMLEENTSYTKKSLEEAIIKRFGEDSRFFACSADSMNPSQVVDFLEMKGKFVAKADGFNTDSSKMCDH